MNYQKIYDLFIDRIKTLNREKGDIYYELHHIVPKSFGGKNSEENLILLTLREHIFAHLLLYFINKNNALKKFKMLSSINVIVNGDCHKKCNLFLSKKSILALELIKKNLGKEISGKNNPFYGKKHSEKTKEKLSKIMKNRNVSGKNNPNYGNKWTDDMKKKLSEKRKKWFEIHNDFDPKDVSLEVREKISKSKIGIKNPNSKICKLIFPDGREEIVYSPMYKNMKKLGVSYQSFKNNFIDDKTSINKLGIKMIILFEKGRHSNENKS